MVDKLRIGITGVGSLCGQGVLRALKMSNLNVTTVGLCIDKFSTGLYWCDEARYVPMAKDDEYILALKKVISEERLNLLLVGTDVELAKLSVARQEIEAETGCIVLVSSPFVVELGDDKYKTAKFFEDNNYASPYSFIPTDGGLEEEQYKKITYPVIVKPRNGARSYGVVKVNNRNELLNAIALTKEPVVQECVGSDAAEYTACGVYLGGICRGTIVMRRELRDGNTYRAFPVCDKNLNAIVAEWTNLVKPFGPINFQFRLDVNGVPKVFEINSRFSGTTPLRARVGFNEVEMCIRYLLLGEEVSQPAVKEMMILRHWEETVVELDAAKLRGWH